MDRLREIARQMARSGRFCSWRVIQIELRFMQGIREAEFCFGDTAIRTELDNLCREAQKRARRASYLRAPATEARTIPAPAVSQPRQSPAWRRVRVAN